MKQTCLKAHDIDAMVFPLAIAAAAYLVQKPTHSIGYVLVADTKWCEVEIIAELDR